MRPMDYSCENALAYCLEALVQATSKFEGLVCNTCLDGVVARPLATNPWSIGLFPALLVSVVPTHLFIFPFGLVDKLVPEIKEN